jgi:lipoate-protein ligase B
LLLLEHPPVVTLGRSHKPENLLESSAQLALRGVALHEVARGGDVTYHAPGQLVGYPIVDLAARGAADVHRFLRELEAGLIEALEHFELPARRVDEMTGVFLARKSPADRERKIASIGIGLRHWITCHGFALNVSLDLAGFDVVVPCGLARVDMTSVAAELERAGQRVPADLDALVREAVAESMVRRLEL